MANTYTNAKLDLTTTAVTVLYTCPILTTGIVKSMLISDDSGVGDSLVVTITSGTEVFNLFKDFPVGNFGTEELLFEPLVVQAGEILKVTATTANRLHVVASIMEIT